MVTTPFSDAIVNPSELRRRQAHWLAVAATAPITVTYGDFKLAILNRDKIAGLFKATHYLELGIKLCMSARMGGGEESLPWMKHLDTEEKIEFTNELISAISEAANTNNWNKVDTILDDWKATAETLASPEVMSALLEKRPKSEYIPMK
jgi:hypothetical protein